MRYHMAPMPTFADTLIQTLEPLAKPARAVPMAAYMKGHFDFLGLSSPERRAAATPLIRAAQGMGADELIETAHALWLLPRREYQYVAIDLLTRYWKTLRYEDIDALLALVKQKSWWDTVDGLASIIGDICHAQLARDPGCQRRMDLALADPNLWVRRVAMLHQNGWRGATDTDRLFGYATRLAPETDFFIRKAIGWALRDYARHDPAAVRAFLAAEGKRFSGLTVREAGKHL